MEPLISLITIVVLLIKLLDGKTSKIIVYHYSSNFTYKCTYALPCICSYIIM